jgi:transposase-like protein
VARSLGISENLLYRWKGSNKTSGQQNGVSQQEYDQLRRSEQERDI